MHKLQVPVFSSSHTRRASLRSEKQQRQWYAEWHGGGQRASVIVEECVNWEGESERRKWDEKSLEQQ